MENKTVRPKRCVSCKNLAEIDILYPFCGSCFLKHYTKRVFKVIKKFKLIEDRDNILVAVSGGKDSLSCADILNQYKELVNFKLAVLHMDVEVQECTNQRTLDIVESFCKERNIPFYFLKFSEYLGIDRNELFFRTRRPRCSVCGMLKRYILNKFAYENGFNKIATGHCADDIVRFFFKNWTDGHFSWIYKMQPKTEPNHKKQITRIRPLFEMLEEENFSYTKFRNIKITDYSKCSLSIHKDKWSELLKIIAQKNKLFILQFVRGLCRINWPQNTQDFDVKECIICGQPTDTKICAVCRLVKKSTVKDFVA